jgi:hypothetical protein
MAKVKARCPACSARMRAKDKFCGACGRRSPIFPATGAPAAKTGRPVLVKPAAPATVTEIRRARLLREIHAETNSDQRQVYTRQLTDLMRGGAA